MKSLNFLFIFNCLINVSFLLIPIWKIKDSSVEISTGETLDVYEGENNQKTVKLTKTIEKKENYFDDYNTIIMNNKNEKNTTWEDIESFYHFTNEDQYYQYYICPKGRNYINGYDENSNSFYVREIENFEDTYNLNSDDEWELICYYQSKRNYIFAGFLNQEKIKKFYGLYLKSNSWQSVKVDDGFYDFLWTYIPTNPYDDNRNTEYKMFGLVQYESQITLEKIYITIDTTYNIQINIAERNSIVYKSNYTHGYFYDNQFYWMSCNITDDFKCGYSTEKINISSKNDANVQNIIHDKSPFDFLDSFEIQKLNMIRNSPFVYYKIKSNDDNQIYYGIIDIISNRIIFNTNEILTEYKPFTNFSMLAFTTSGVYQICAFKEDDQCVKNCSSGKILILDTVNGNHCGTSQDCEYYLFIPDNICIEYCDKTLYVSNENKECGLCMDLYNGENGNEYKPYKYINGTECLEYKPNGTYYVYEKYKIIDNCSENCRECNNSDICTECDDGFILYNGKCIEKEKNCNQNCEDCDIYSENDNEQKCTKCKDNMLLQIDKGNCVNECLDSYYKNGSLCLKCNLNCTKCSEGEEIMENGELNQNCDECIDFKYLLVNNSKNCVDECPIGYNITDDKYCNLSESGNGTNPNNGENKKTKNPDYMLWVFMVIIALLLIITALCLCKRYCPHKKKDSDLIEDINNELQINRLSE